MNEWKMVRLGDISALITKGTTPTTIGYNFQKTGVVFLKIECFDDSGNYIDEKSVYISDECNEKLKRSQLEAGDILFSIAGAIGRVAIVTDKMLPANTNQALAIIRIKRDDVYIPYIKLLLTSPMVKKQFECKKQGVAQLNISLKDISELMIPLPDLTRQTMYVNFFDKITAIINARKQQLSALDDLIKARFVEMFGDVKENNYNWEIKSFDELFEIASSKRILKSEWKNHGIPFLRVRDMVQLADKGNINNEFFISEAFYSTLTDTDGIPKSGDILMSATSTLGKCHIVLDGEKFYFKDADVLRFRPKKEINARYFVEAIKADYVVDQINKTLGVTTVSHFTIKAAKTICLRVPPLELQKEFSDFVAQTDKTKDTIQKSLEKTQLLFDSLMQEYFG